MAENMWAIVKEKAGAGLALVKAPVPEIESPDDVKIRIRKTAICGTDVHIYNWDEWSQRTIKLGQIVGHEFVGEIAELGANVHGYKVGDLVTGEGHIVCGKCRNCRSGRGHLCKATVGIGVNRDGCFAEYMVMPATNLCKCARGIPEEMYAVFDPFGNAAHTALSFNLLGEDTLITGAGPIGIMAVATARFAGARNIVITDTNDYRLALAKRLGATRTVNILRDNLKDVMHELGIHEGFDIGLEMSGNIAALNQMLDNMYTGGKIGLLGILKQDAVINWDKVIFGGLTLKGIYGREMYETWYKMTAMLQGGLDLSPIITHRFSYADFQQGFDAMISGNSGKVILDWTGI